MLDSTRKITDRLAGVSSSLPRNTQEVFDVLDEISRLSDPSAVVGVLPLIWSAYKDDRSSVDMTMESYKREGNLTIAERYPIPELVRSRAIGIAADLVAAGQLHEYPELDRELRCCGYGSFGGSRRWQRWIEYAPPDLSDMPEVPERVWLLGIMACNNNGYRREAPLRQLSHYFDGNELRFLLWRTADSVVEVRTIAREAVLKRVTMDDYVPYFEKMLPLLVRMDRAGRVDLTDLTFLIRQTVQREL